MKTNKKEKAKSHTSATMKNLMARVNPKSLSKTKKQMLLAAKIADAMEERGIKKIKLAEMLHKEPSVITRWLSGTHNFTVEILSEIEDVLGISLLNVESKQTVMSAGSFHIRVVSGKKAATTCISTEQTAESWNVIPDSKDLYKISKTFATA